MDRAHILHDVKLRELEAELSRRGRFSRIIRTFSVRNTLHNCGMAYIADSEHSQTTVALSEDSGLIHVAATMLVARPIPSAALYPFLASDLARFVERDRGTQWKTPDSGLALRLSRSTPDSNLVAQIAGETISDLHWAMYSAHAVLRRAGLACYIVRPAPELLWGNAVQDIPPRQTGTESKHYQTGRLSVYYTDELAGGGQLWGDEVVDFVKEAVGPVQAAHELCSGPGFIGFSLLSRGLCRQLSLSDVNPLAIDACLRTIDQNDLSDCTSTYVSDCLNSIPLDQRWSLVIANPPWMPFHERIPQWGQPIKYEDPDLLLHRRIFTDVIPHLENDGHIVLVESYMAAAPRDFENIGATAGLFLSRVYQTRFPTIYCLVFKRR